MAEEIGNQESAEQNGPVVQLQRCYFKDASLEMPACAGSLHGGS